MTAAEKAVQQGGKKNEERALQSTAAKKND